MITARCNVALRGCSIIAAMFMVLPLTALAQGRTGDVYVMTNQVSGNSVMVFHRDASGALTYLATYASGGNGIGTGADPLGSQHSLVLSEDERFLVTVNAGSNSISEFAVFGDQLKLLSTVPSGGTMPVSVAVKFGRVYVVNAGGTPNISGFLIDPETNQLKPLAESTQSLPGGATASPAQISFSPDGSVLVVTEKGTNLVDTFPVEFGIARAGVSFASSGTEPFGFEFGRDNAAIVSNASGGAAGGTTVTSYRVFENGNVGVITPALGDTQTAACWLVLAWFGKYAYAANSASGTISSYNVTEEGQLTLLNATAASLAGGAPIDMALSRDETRFLYVRNAASGSIDGFSVGSDGSLTSIGSVSGVPSGAQGVAAR